MSWPNSADLAKDTWALSAQWSARPDDLAACTERLLASLRGLAELDPGLGQWFHDDEPVPVAAEGLRDRLDRGWDREHPGGETGSTVPLWNGVADDLGAATFSVSCGSTASYFRNRLELRPPRPAAAPGLYERDAMVGLFDLMLTAWQPQWCRVQPWSLRDATNGEFVDVLASWVVYLDHDLYTRTGELPAEVTVLERPAGTLFVLAQAPDALRLSTVDRMREVIAFPDEWNLLR
jgi:immunity protein 52 of polymorphic toxin system